MWGIRGGNNLSDYAGKISKIMVKRRNKQSREK